MNPALAVTPNLQTDRWKDHGPFYTETNFDRTIVEPWNAASALLFVFIALFWLYRLRGQYRAHVFLTCCLPILLAGGIGGTLFHALRSSRIFFNLDVIPIGILGVIVSVFLLHRLRAQPWHVILTLSVFLLVRLVSFRLPHHQMIMTSYALLGAMILLPLLLVMRRTRFVHASWIIIGLVSFAAALYFRFVDARRPPLLPMGTHWLWHVFGAVTTAMLAEYLYRLSNSSQRAQSTSGAANS